MKVKSFRRACALALGAVLLMSVAGAALADDPTPTPAPASVSYKGNQVFEYSPDDANMTLWSFTNVMPGDELYRTVSIKNDFARTVEVYMRAEPANPENAAETDFLSKLTFEVKRGDDTLNSTLTSGDDAWPNGALSAENEKDKLYYCALGDVTSGDSVDLVVKLTVPETLGNAYQEAMGKVRWVIVIVEKYVPPTSPRPSYPPYSPPYSPYTPYTYVPYTYEPIPLGEPIVQVDGEEIPLGTPYTGDEAKIPTAAICAAVCGVALLIVAIVAKKKRKAE